jgi:hypothetical protein
MKPQRKSPKTASKQHHSTGKVGSDRQAEKEFGGELDFGIPAKKASPCEPEGGRAKGPEPGTGPMRSDDRGVRTNGVGHAPGRDGDGSGGDLDPDFIGLDGRGGIANTPPSHRTTGPDITEGGSAPFASGPPAAGKNQKPRRTRVRGSTVDRTGGDASTTGQGGGADTTEGPAQSEIAEETGAAFGRRPDIPDNAAAGEISSDEASGQG